MHLVNIKMNHYIENESSYSVYCSGPKTLPKYNNKASCIDGMLKSPTTSLFSKALQLYHPVCQVTGEYYIQLRNLLRLCSSVYGHNILQEVMLLQ